MAAYQKKSEKFKVIFFLSYDDFFSTSSYACV